FKEKTINTLREEIEKLNRAKFEFRKELIVATSDVENTRDEVVQLKFQIDFLKSSLNAVNEQNVELEEKLHGSADNLKSTTTALFVSESELKSNLEIVTIKKEITNGLTNELSLVRKEMQSLIAFRDIEMNRKNDELNKTLEVVKRVQREYESLILERNKDQDSYSEILTQLDEILKLSETLELQTKKNLDLENLLSHSQLLVEKYGHEVENFYSERYSQEFKIEMLVKNKNENSEISENQKVINQQHIFSYILEIVNLKSLLTSLDAKYSQSKEEIFVMKNQIENLTEDNEQIKLHLLESQDISINATEAWRMEMENLKMTIENLSQFSSESNFPEKSDERNLDLIANIFPTSTEYSSTMKVDLQNRIFSTKSTFLSSLIQYTPERQKNQNKIDDSNVSLNECEKVKKMMDESIVKNENKLKKLLVELKSARDELKSALDKFKINIRRKDEELLNKTSMLNEMENSYLKSQKRLEEEKIDSANNAEKLHTLVMIEQSNQSMLNQHLIFSYVIEVFSLKKSLEEILTINHQLELHLTELQEFSMNAADSWKLEKLGLQNVIEQLKEKLYGKAENLVLLQSETNINSEKHLSNFDQRVQVSEIEKTETQKFVLSLLKERDQILNQSEEASNELKDLRNQLMICENDISELGFEKFIYFEQQANDILLRTKLIVLEEINSGFETQKLTNEKLILDFNARISEQIKDIKKISAENLHLKQEIVILTKNTSNTIDALTTKIFENLKYICSNFSSNQVFFDSLDLDSLQQFTVDLCVDAQNNLLELSSKLEENAIKIEDLTQSLSEVKETLKLSMLNKNRYTDQIDTLNDEITKLNQTINHFESVFDKQRQELFFSNQPPLNINLADEFHRLQQFALDMQSVKETQNNYVQSKLEQTHAKHVSVLMKIIDEVNEAMSAQLALQANLENRIEDQEIKLVTSAEIVKQLENDKIQLEDEVKKLEMRNSFTSKRSSITSQNNFENVNIEDQTSDLVMRKVFEERKKFSGSLVKLKNFAVVASKLTGNQNLELLIREVLLKYVSLTLIYFYFADRTKLDRNDKPT
ncbi:hypothetical protein HK096_003052, partial [Nowakowskiella sp. JEL0078]